ncbi:MAG TPA: ATP-binding protein [Dongiaceae bacterium]|nr:ATP-binding protein [Dongiaceae bacterium]
MSAVAEMLRSAVDARTGRLSSFLKHSPLALAECDRHGNITASNKAFDQFVGEHSSVRNQTIPELTSPYDSHEVQQLLSELFQGRRNNFQMECPPQGAEDRLLRWTVWAQEDEANEAGHAFVFVEDVSSVATARERLHQAERLEAMGRLAGGVAHDFNNLLTGVLLYCDLLMNAIELGHRARKYAEEIRTAGMHATGLVRQLLSITRSNKSAPRAISLNEVAEGMHDLLSRLVGESIQLRFSLAPDLGLVRMDPVHVQQILLNLVLNARDALPRGGHISVETGNCRLRMLPQSGMDSGENASVSCAVFAVEDNGVGMDEAVRAHLFEPFFTTKAGKGTGIGLATVHDIVTSSGGLIHVRSEVNRGTRLSILLPLIPDSVPAAQPDTSFHPNNGEVLSFQSKEPTP